MDTRVNAPLSLKDLKFSVAPSSEPITPAPLSPAAQLQKLYDDVIGLQQKPPEATPDPDIEKANRLKKILGWSESRDAYWKTFAKPEGNALDKIFPYRSTLLLNHPSGWPPDSMRNKDIISNEEELKVNINDALTFIKTSQSIDLDHLNPDNPDDLLKKAGEFVSNNSNGFIALHLPDKEIELQPAGREKDLLYSLREVLKWHHSQVGDEIYDVASALYDGIRGYQAVHKLRSMMENIPAELKPVIGKYFDKLEQITSDNLYNESSRKQTESLIAAKSTFANTRAGRATEVKLLQEMSVTPGIPDELREQLKQAAAQAETGVKPSVIEADHLHSDLPGTLAAIREQILFLRAQERATVQENVHDQNKSKGGLLQYFKPSVEQPTEIQRLNRNEINDQILVLENALNALSRNVRLLDSDRSNKGRVTIGKSLHDKNLEEYSVDPSLIKDDELSITYSPDGSQAHRAELTLHGTVPFEMDEVEIIPDPDGLIIRTRYQTPAKGDTRYIRTETILHHDRIIHRYTNTMESVQKPVDNTIVLSNPDADGNFVPQGGTGIPDISGLLSHLTDSILIVNNRLNQKQTTQVRP